MAISAGFREVTGGSRGLHRFSDKGVYKGSKKVSVHFRRFRGVQRISGELQKRSRAVKNASKHLSCDLREVSVCFREDIGIVRRFMKIQWLSESFRGASGGFVGFRFQEDFRGFRGRLAISADFR